MCVCFLSKKMLWSSVPCVSRLKRLSRAVLATFSSCTEYAELLVGALPIACFAMQSNDSYGSVSAS